MLQAALPPGAGRDVVVPLGPAKSWTADHASTFFNTWSMSARSAVFKKASQILSACGEVLFRGVGRDPNASSPRKCGFGHLIGKGDRMERLIASETQGLDVRADGVVEPVRLRVHLQLLEMRSARRVLHTQGRFDDRDLAL